MKTICLYSEEFPPDTNYGGISIYNQNLADILSERGFKVVVITKSIKDSSYAIDGGNIIVYRVKPYFSKISFLEKLLGFRLASFFQFLKLNRRYSFTLVETPEWKADSFFLFFFKRFIPKCPPLVLRLHGCRAIIRSIQKQEVRCADKIIINMEGYIMRKSNYITSISNACLKKTEECMNLSLSHKTTIIFNSTDLPKIYSTSLNYVEPKFILFVGRIELLKGVFNLANVIVNILDEFNDVKFIFAGRDIIDSKSGIMSSELIKNIVGRRNLDKITFTGQLDKESLDILYKTAYCTVLPSSFESFGLCCIESMKYGTPVIGSRNGGMSEIITDEIDGFLINPENITEIKDKIVFLLKNPYVRNKLAVLAADKIKTTFSNDVIFEQIESFYDNITNTN